MEARTTRSTLLPAAAALVFVTLAYSLHLFVFLRLRGAETTWIHELGESAVHWAAWLVLAPAVLALARRVRLTPRPAAIAAHAIGGAAVVLLQILIRATLDQTLLHGQWTVAAVEDGFVATFGRTFFGGLATYGAFVIGRETLIRIREQREEAAVRERELAVAQLAVLQNQLEPHFLFNALNGVSSLMHQDVAAANRMLLHLSSLLRALLEENGSPEITVARESELLRDYVAVEEARLAERLRFEISIEPAVQQALIPRLLLQPLVENSIRHAISPRREGGSVAVIVRASGSRLRISVRDDGPGLAAVSPAQGIGLRNTRARLERLYGDDHRFAIDGTHGTAIEIEIPLRLAAIPAAEMAS